MKVTRCNNCGADIGAEENPTLSGERGDGNTRGSLGGVRKTTDLLPGQEFDWCGLCSTVAIRSLDMARPLIQAMREQPMTDYLAVRALDEYSRSGEPMHDGDEYRLGLMEDKDVEEELKRRFGAQGWQVALVALDARRRRRAAAGV